MNSSQLEHIAEDRITHELQKEGLLVAKPKEDRLGTDLLVFAEMADGVKFCRVQCKGRSLINSNSTHIQIPVSYVTNGFIVVLYLEIHPRVDSLYIFFPSDINQWTKTESKRYRLTISKTNVSDKLDFFRFDSSKVNLIKILIQNAETSGEFRRLVYGRANVKLPMPQGCANGHVSRNE